MGLFQALTSSKVTAIVETSGIVRSFLNQTFPQIQCFADTESLFAANAADAVVIATPPATHTAIALESAKRKIPFFVEKPLCREAKEAETLAQFLADNPVAHCVGYMNRFIEIFKYARTVVNSGCLGKLHTLRTSMYISQLFKKGTGWRYSKKDSGGGVLITQNSHLLDLLIWIFGPVKEVSAQIQSIYSQEVEDQAHAYLYFQNGLQGFLDTSWSKRHHRTLSIIIHVEGENGSLTVNDDEVTFFLDQPLNGYPAGWSTKRKPDLFSGECFDIAGPQYTRQAKYFVDLALQGITTDPQGADVRSALMVQRLIDSIYLSASQRGTLVVAT